MEFLRKLIRIALSTFIPFVILAKIENTYIPYQAHPIIHMHEFALYDLKVLFAATMPWFYVVAVVIQTLVIISVWDALVKKGKMALFFLLIVALIIVSSVGLNYMLWERSMGFAQLLKSSLTLMGIQSIYWLFNLLTLYVLDKFHFFNTKPVATVTEIEK